MAVDLGSSASTTPTDVDTAISEIWSKRTLREHKVAGFWGKFVGPVGSGAPIIQQSELLGGPGDRIHIQVTAPLTGAGISGDTALLTGQEENLATTQILVEPVLKRNGVRWYRRAAKKSVVELRPEARMRLSEWGMVKMDTMRFAQFTSILGADVPDGVYPVNTFYVQGDATPTIDEIVAADVFTVAELQKIKLKLTLQHAKPVYSKDGQPFYFLVMHPNAAYQLKQDTRYEAWVREARERSESNPLFTGALAVIDGLVLYEHENVPVATNAGAIQYSKNLAFGAEAFVEGLDENVTWAEEEFDYGNEFGIGYGFAFQPRRALQLSSILVYSAAVAV
jgi:N4-gp56 family major capsid protein